MIVEYCIGGCLLIISIVVHIQHVIYIHKKYITPLILDNVIQTELTKQHIPGLCVSIIKSGKIEYIKAYGKSNVELNTDMSIYNIFEIASVGKQFIAFGIMLLLQDGKLSLENSIDQYFKDSPNQWKEITIYQLLTHTSGLGDFPKNLKLMKNIRLTNF